MIPSSTMCRAVSRLEGYYVARLLFFVVVTGHLAIALLLGGCTSKDTGRRERYLRAKASWDDGARASIQALSEELHRHPQADMYRIVWGVGPEGSEVRRATVYMRKYGIYYEYDPGSGSVVEWSHVDDQAIHLVARRNGTFEDFGTPSSGRTAMPPENWIEPPDRCLEQHGKQR